MIIVGHGFCLYDSTSVSANTYRKLRILYRLLSRISHEKFQPFLFRYRKTILRAGIFYNKKKRIKLVKNQGKCFQVSRYHSNTIYSCFLMIDIQHMVCYVLRSKNKFLYKYNKFVKIRIQRV